MPALGRAESSLMHPNGQDVSVFAEHHFAQAELESLAGIKIHAKTDTQPYLLSVRLLCDEPPREEAGLDKAASCWHSESRAVSLLLTACSGFLILLGMYLLLLVVTWTHIV